MQCTTAVDQKVLVVINKPQVEHQCFLLLVVFTFLRTGYHCLLYHYRYSTRYVRVRVESLKVLEKHAKYHDKK